MTPYNRKQNVLSASLNKIFPSFLIYLKHDTILDTPYVITLPSQTYYATVYYLLVKSVDANNAALNILYETKIVIINIRCSIQNGHSKTRTVQQSVKCVMNCGAVHD